MKKFKVKKIASKHKATMIYLNNVRRLASKIDNISCKYEKDIAKVNGLSIALREARKEMAEAMKIVSKPNMAYMALHCGYNIWLKVMEIYRILDKHVCNSKNGVTNEDFINIRRLKRWAENLEELVWDFIVSLGYNIYIKGGKEG